MLFAIFICDEQECQSTTLNIESTIGKVLIGWNLDTSVLSLMLNGIIVKRNVVQL